MCQEERGRAGGSGLIHLDHLAVGEMAFRVKACSESGRIERQSSLRRQSGHNVLQDRNFLIKRECHACVSVVSTLIGTTIAQRQCPRNQEWTTCGSACPPSCNSGSNRPCTLQCVVGCQCRNGYVLNSRGTCVLPQQC